MDASLFDMASSLIDIIGAETTALRSAGRRENLAEIVAAKARLVSQLDRKVAELQLEEMPEETRRQLATLFERLHQAAMANGEALQRQIELSTEMMAAVSAEARRALGTRSAAYSALGELWGFDGQTPIALNASL